MYFLISLATIVALSPRALADCYFPNGDVSGSDTACIGDNAVSSCCFGGQACLSNGLCVSDPHNATIARIHRGTCTDQTWKSDSCPKHCTSINNNGVPVYSCNQTNTDSYCCFDNCKCNNNFEVFSYTTADPYTVTIIGEAFTNTHTATASSAAASTTGGASAQTTGASAASATATSTSTSAASTSNKDNSSNATAIGVGVGVGVGGVLLLGAAAFFFWRRKKRNNPDANAYSGSAKNPAEVENTEYYPPPAKYAYYAEASSQNSATPFSAAPTELPSESSHAPVELPASPHADARDAKRVPGLQLGRDWNSNVQNRIT